MGMGRSCTPWATPTASGGTVVGHELDKAKAVAGAPSRGGVGGGGRRAPPCRTLRLDRSVGPPPASVAMTAPADARSTDLRLAGVHLRLGQYAFARAELETLAVRGVLDREALADLAEARWRTGG